MLKSKQQRQSLPYQTADTIKHAFQEPNSKSQAWPFLNTASRRSKAKNIAAHHCVRISHALVCADAIVKSRCRRSSALASPIAKTTARCNSFLILWYYLQVIFHICEPLGVLFVELFSSASPEALLAFDESCPALVW